jgi:hypothetical protein
MPSTVFQTIDVHSRNHLIRNRDALESQFGIEIRFPMNKVRGQFQDMALNGGTKAIFEAQKKISIILADWQHEFDAFKYRKTRRQLQQMTEESSAIAWPSIPNREEYKAFKSSNPFDVLGVDEEESVMENVPVVKPKKTTLTGWSKVVASAPSYATSSATSSAPSSTPSYAESSATSWADMSDEEE